MLATSTSVLLPMECTPLKRFSVELVAALSILGNITKFQVFQDDQHILEFILSSWMFEGQMIDEEPKEGEEKDNLDEK